MPAKRILVLATGLLIFHSVMAGELRGLATFDSEPYRQAVESNTAVGAIVRFPLLLDAEPVSVSATNVVGTIRHARVSNRGSLVLRGSLHRAQAGLVETGQFILVERGGAVAGALWLPSIGPMRIRPVSQSDGAFCGGFRVEAPHRPVLGCAGDFSLPEQLSTRPWEGGTAGTPCSCPDTGEMIDVLVVYSTDARVAAGGAAAIEAIAEASMEFTTQAFANSAVGPLELRIVHMQEVAYDETVTQPVDHLIRLSTNGDGILDEVHGLRDQHRADLVHLLIDDLNGGLGWRNVYDPAAGFTVCGWYAASFGFITGHEIGHNLGCAHDRPNHFEYPNEFRYGYGHSFAVGATTYGTLLSYIGTPTPHYSNPSVQFLGVSTGVPLSQSQPAHNALMIENARRSIANYRASGLAADCNGNQVEDVLDIALGTSRDDNENCVPDECERILYVAADSPSDGDGFSWATAKRSLQEALLVAGVPCANIRQIWVKSGVYRPDEGSGERSAAYWLIGGVALYGGFAGNETSLEQRNLTANPTTLSGDIGVAGDSSDNSYTVLVAIGASRPIIIDGFVVEGAMNPGVGGGLYAASSQITLRNCVFREHVAQAGAAVALYDCFEVRAEDCEFAGNQAAGGGGAILCASSVLTLERCDVRENHANEGAGLMMFGAASSVRLTDSRVRANTAVVYAGAAALFDGTAEIHGSLFFENAAENAEAGGIWAYGLARFEVERTSFIGHTATGYAGAIGLYASSAAFRETRFIANHAREGAAISAAFCDDLAVEACEFRGNQAVNRGGAMDVFGGSLVLRNSILVGNRALTTEAGAMYLSGSSSAAVVNCTVYGNQAATVGGGLSSWNTSPMIANTIFWSNTDSGGGGETAQIHQYFGPLPIRYSTVQGWTGGLGGVGNNGSNPMLADPAQNDFQLRSGSPCIDAGENSAVGSGVTMDFAGNPRFVDDPARPDTGVGPPPVVDRGALEHQLALLRGDLNCDGLLNNFDIDPFVLALTDPETYAGQYPECSVAAADINGDGLVNNFDIDPFVSCLTAGNCP